MNFRGIRGATSVDANEPSAILLATRRLLKKIVAANHLQVDDVAGVIFSATLDLDAVYPAQAAREMGWVHVPLLCTQEMDVAGSLGHCIRVMVFWNTDLPAEKIRHVYLGAAQALRPDLVKGEKND